MSYELSGIEWKLTSDQLEKKFLLFHDIQVLERNIWGNPIDSNINFELAIKATAYKIITIEFHEFFIAELHRIRKALANYQIEDDPDKFSRYIQANYKGLLKLRNSNHDIKPAELKFNSPRFTSMFKKIALHQINYDLQTLFVIPLKDTFEEEYQSELHPHPYIYSISKKQEEKQVDNSKLQWNGKVNQLVTFFYDLSNDVVIDGKPALNASQNEIAEFIVNNFVDKNGHDLSKATVKTILSPGKADKRSPEHMKFQILIK